MSIISENDQNSNGDCSQDRDSSGFTYDEWLIRWSLDGGYYPGVFDPEVRDYSEVMAMSRSHLIPELLRMLGYDLPSIGEIVDHVIIYGTAEGCPEFRDESDRRAVEDMLPEAPMSDWDYYDSEWSTISLNGNRGSQYR